MSNNTIPSIETLPVELLHRIFDNVNAETILFSIRPVCRLFRAVVNTYDRYDLDLKLISKPNFYVLCRLIDPRNVISLTLSNDERTLDQIDLFISLVRLRQFTRLRSITLLNIDECQLNFILKRINPTVLTSFTFKIRKYDNRRRKTTTNLFSSFITQSSIRKVELDIEDIRMSIIPWPNSCTIQYLTINNSISTYNLCKIFQCSPYLHTLVMKRRMLYPMDNIIATPFRQLTSLTIENFNMTLEKLESFLLLTLSLVHLKVIGDGSKILNGKRWEQFIEMNLPNLDKFEFFFNVWNSDKKTVTELEIILDSFQTPFWIEHKKWFVACEYNIDWSNWFHIYSTPICESFLMYGPQFRKISLPTCTMTIEDDSTITNNVKSLQLRLDKTLADHIQEKKATTNHLLFPKVITIDINLTKDWFSLSLEPLSLFIDFTQIVEMKLNSYDFDEYKQKTWIDIGIFLEQAHQLSLLTIIDTSLKKFKLPRIMKNLCSILPRHVKHLQIPLNDLDQIKMIFERCENLSSVCFDVSSSKFSEEVIKWFADNTINSTCQKGQQAVAVWLGKKTIQSDETRVNNKRMKLTDDHLDS